MGFIVKKIASNFSPGVKNQNEHNFFCNQTVCRTPDLIRIDGRGEAYVEYLVRSYWLQ